MVEMAVFFFVFFFLSQKKNRKETHRNQICFCIFVALLLSSFFIFCVFFFSQTVFLKQDDFVGSWVLLFLGPFFAGKKGGPENCHQKMGV